MAIAFGAALGHDDEGTGSSTTIDLTSTTNTVPSGGTVYLLITGYNSGLSISGITPALGGWTISGSPAGLGDANYKVWVARAYAPSGLASSSTIQATYSGASFFRTITAGYFTGLPSTPVEDEVTTTPVGGGTTWTTGDHERQ
jgi:hypothetical protein